MIWIILGIGLVLIGLSFLFYRLDDYDSGFFLFSAVTSGVIGGIVFVISVLFAIGFIHNAVVLNTVDERIAMYEEENTKIEERIDGVVKGYQEYEGKTFENFAPDADAMTMIYLYPELKSDALVQEQISLYVSNVEKIKELKEEKISGRVTRWWLYFGE